MIILHFYPGLAVCRRTQPGGSSCCGSRLITELMEWGLYRNDTSTHRGGSIPYRAFNSLRGSVPGLLFTQRHTVQSLLFTQRHSAGPTAHLKAQRLAIHSLRGSVQGVPFIQRLSAGPTFHSEAQCPAYYSLRGTVQGLPFT